MPIKCRLISPTELLLERPVYEPPEIGTEFLIVSEKEWRERIRREWGSGFFLGCLFVALLAMLIFAIAGHAQTRYTGSADVGLDQGLGFEIPTVDLIGGIERPIGRRFELDAAGTYGFTRKAADEPRPNGRTAIVSVTPIIWATPWLGLTGEINCNWLFTTAYNKAACSHFPAPGVVFRARPLGLPSRLWLAGVIPSGSIDRKTGIESNRVSGVQFAWEARIGHIGPADVRLILGLGVYHGYSQGNPLCDGTDGPPVTCPRASWTTYTDDTTVRLVFPRNADAGNLW